MQAFGMLWWVRGVGKREASNDELVRRAIRVHGRCLWLSEFPRELLALCGTNLLAVYYENDIIKAYNLISKIKSNNKEKRTTMIRIYVSKIMMMFMIIFCLPLETLVTDKMVLTAKFLDVVVAFPLTLLDTAQSFPLYM